MIPLFLNRKSTARWNTTLRSFWRWVVVFAFLLAVPTAGASARIAVEGTQDVLPLPPLPLEPLDHSYVTPPSVFFRWAPTEGAGWYRVEISREDGLMEEHFWTDGNTTSAMFDGLEPGYTYLWNVEVDVDTQGSSYDRFEFTLAAAPIPPMPPQNIHASDGAYDDEVLIWWDHSYRTAYYQLQRRAPGGTEFVDLARLSDSREYKDREPAVEQHYAYRVLACNSAGCSAPSPVDEGWVGACYPVPAPKLIAPANGSVIITTYQDPEYVMEWEQVPNATYHRLIVWDVDTGCVHTDETLEGEQGVFFTDTVGNLAWKVIAGNPTQGCPASPPSETWTFQVVRSPPPAVPVNVQASDGAYSDRILITWEQPPSESELESFQIWRATEPDVTAAVEIAAWYGEHPSHMDEEVTPGTVYYYWIEACSHADGCSEKSAPDSGFAGEVLPIIDYSLFLPILGR